MIEITSSDQENLWEVAIKFKKRPQDSEVFLARMTCLTEDGIIECDRVSIEPAG